MNGVLVLIMHVLSVLGITYDEPSALPVCSDRTDVVSVWRDDPTPCDVQPWQRIDVYGLTIAECDDLGGEPIVLVTGEGVCEGVDH
jgi:hypothetical protein